MNQEQTASADRKFDSSRAGAAIIFPPCSSTTAFNTFSSYSSCFSEVQPIIITRTSVTSLSGFSPYSFHFFQNSPGPNPRHLATYQNNGGVVLTIRPILHRPNTYLQPTAFSRDVGA